MRDGARVDILLAKSYDPDTRVRRTGFALADAGYRVRVLAWDRSGRREIETNDGPLRIRRVRVLSRPSRGATQVFFLLRVARELARIMRADPPAVIHAVDLPMLTVALWLAAILPGPRPAIVYDAFEIHALMGAHRYSGWLIFLIRVVERVLPRFADLVITPGEARRAYFANRGIESIAVPNWIDPPAVAPSREEARARIGVGREQFCLVYAGGILGSRDLDPLLAHARRHPDDLVLIAGGGDEAPRLREASADLPNVRLLGWVPDITDLVAAADALYYALKPTHPYAPHAAPNNLYVAIANAVPLLYRPQGELAIVGTRHRVGEPFRDDESLALAIERLRDPDANEAIRRELREIQSRYRWTDAARRLVEAYPRPTRTPRLLLVTRLWPTAERPGVGTFVRERAAGVPGIRVARPRREGLPRPILYLLLLWDALRMSSRVDGVEAHMILPTGLVGLVVARLRRVPLVIYSHGRDARSYANQAAPLRAVTRMAVRASARIVTNSAETAELLRDTGVEPVVIVPGTNLSRFRPTPRPSARRVLYMGGRVSYKGYEVARELADTLVGPGLAEVEHRDVPKLIAEHDVLLVPSLTEAFGLVAVEAIASGRWVVANAIGGLREIVQDGVNGTLVTDGDFAGAIARVPDYDPVAISRTVERFSLERWQGDMAALWDEVLGCAEAPPPAAADA